MQKDFYPSGQIRAEIGLDLKQGRNPKKMILCLYPRIYIVAMGFWLRITFHVVFKYAGPKKNQIWPVSGAGLRSLARIIPTLGYLAKLWPIYKVESHYFLSDIPVYNKTMIENHI